MITWERLVELLHYDPETGEFTWKKPTSNRVKIGSKANNISPTTGEVRVRVDGKLYSGHRLAWFYMTKDWPELLIDHRNGQRADNRFSNLREATHSQNSHNYGARGANQAKGVEKHYGKFKATIMVEGKRLYLGRFETLEEASMAYKEASLKYHKEFSPFLEGNNNGNTGPEL